VFKAKRNRWKLLCLFGGTIVFSASSYVHAQAEYGEAPLGDVARSFRKKIVSSESVIDNDNLPKMMDDAETRRAAGSTPVFALDSGGKSVHVSSADVTCSLSFTGKTSQESDPALLDELPRSELAKLDGPATLNGDSLEVSMHNGTAWELREVVIGLTIVKRTQPAEAISSYGQARIVPAAAGGELQSETAQNGPSQDDSFRKQPDVTMLLRVKGMAAPATNALFRTALNFALFPDQEWHWAIVKAKGIPPKTLPEVTQTDPQSVQPDDAGVQVPVLAPALSTSSPRLVPSTPSAAR
jgi:hypothetical protein